ncbi:MAG: SGNH/GDSL hydrolase family protein [Roseburia sp.]|nr:SGNH/GDSL hydrolase family protein [Roseburia sp.]MCM1098623.1 SGNH/GDSL hydrolase family protein [Ruminococcus flavefaciens]
MGRKVRGRTILYALLSAVLFAAFFLSPCFAGRTEKYPVQIVFFGDSVYGNIRDGSGIPDQVGELLGKSVYNAAFGGTCTGRNRNDTSLDFSGDSLSLAALTKAVYADDFGVQQTIQPQWDITVYFQEAIDGLERIDFSGVETVLIGHGLNDYYGGIPLEGEDPLDEYTFAGALRRSLIYLQKTNPDMRIVLITPTYSWLLNTGQTCQEYNIGFGVLEDYIRKELEVAAELDVEVIDLYHDLFPHEGWEDWQLYTTDGFHPNEAGRALLAGRIADYLEGETE